MKRTVKFVFVPILMLTAAACSKDFEQQMPGESPVRFDVGVNLTKAELINSADNSSFMSGGFAVTSYEGGTKKMDKVAVTKSGDKWTYSGQYLWKKNTTMRFFGYYPQAMATGLTTSGTGISAFTYSPLSSETATVKGQTDYMLATYSGIGGNEGKAALDFTHPLASIKFIVGTFESSVTAIKSIAIGGFYKTGTCTPTAGTSGFTYAWSGHSGAADDGALPQSDLNLTPASNAEIGTPFLLIPGQNFSSKNLTVLLTVTEGGADKTLLATITSGTLVQGQTTTFAINYDAGEGLNFSTPTITAWDEGASEDITLITETETEE